MAAIVQTVKVQVEGTEEAAAEFKKVGDAGSEAFKQTQQAASESGPAVAQAGKQASAGLGATGAALDETTKKAGLSRREMTALGKVLGSFGGGEIAHAAVSIGKIGATLGALGAAAIGIGMAAQALVKFGSEAIKAGDAIEKVAAAGGGSFEKISSLQAAFAKLGVGAEKFGESALGVLSKIAEAAEKSGDAIAASSKKVDDSQLAYLKAKAAAEPYLASVYAQDIKNLEAQQKVNQAIEAERAHRVALANELGPIIQKYEALAKGVKSSFDVSTTAATRQEAIKFALQDTGGELDKVLIKLAHMADAMDVLQKRQFRADIKGAFPTITDEEINQILKGSAAIQKLGQTKGISKEQVDALNQFKTAWNELVASFAQSGLSQFLTPVVQSLTQFVKQDIPTFIASLVELKAIWFKVWSGFAEVASQALGALGFADASAKLHEFAQSWRQAAEDAGKSAQQLRQNAADAATTGDAVAATGQKAEQAGQGFKNWDQVVQESTGNFKVWDEAAGQAVDATAAVAPAAQTAAQGIGTLNEQTNTTATVFANMAQAVDTSLAQVRAAIDATIAKMAELAKAGTGAPSTGGGGGGGGGGGFARGGLLGGRGTGTSDSNLAWVSRGEFIVPARAVAQPGVLALLESLRLAGGNLRGIFDGMRFAAGGLIMPRAVPAFAGGGMHNVTIQFPGLPEITGLRASSGVVDELRRAAALGQVRSGGRKPSRYS